MTVYHQPSLFSLTKQCSKCGATKPATAEYFHSRPEGKLKLKSKCRECVAAYNRDYNSKHKKLIAEKRRQNIERTREYKRQYRAEKPEIVKAGATRYREAHKALLTQYLKVYREANKEQIAAYNAAWKASNREACRKHDHARKARVAGQPGERTVEDIRQMYEDQGAACAYCEVDISEGYEIDHMLPISRGGRDHWDNLALACIRCNRSKYTKTAEEFMNSK